MWDSFNFFDSGGSGDQAGHGPAEGRDISLPLTDAIQQMEANGLLSANAGLTVKIETS